MGGREREKNRLYPSRKRLRRTLEIKEKGVATTSTGSNATGVRKLVHDKRKKKVKVLSQDGELLVAGVKKRPCSKKKEKGWRDLKRVADPKRKKRERTRGKTLVNDWGGRA